MRRQRAERRARAQAEQLRQIAQDSDQFNEPVTVDSSPDGKVAVIEVPLAGSGSDNTSLNAVKALRNDVVPEVLPIARISELSGVDVVDVRLANNDLDPNLSTTPGRNFPLYLPAGKGAQLSTALAARPPDQPQVMLASRSVPEIGPGIRSDAPERCTFAAPA